MRSFRLWLVLCVALFASACASTPIIDGDSLQAKVGNSIAHAEIALTRGYRFVADQAAAGILLPGELQDALDILDRAAEAIDKARGLYKLGNFEDALDNLANADRAMAFVEAEIAKRLKARRKGVSL